MLDETRKKSFLGFDFSTQKLKAVVIDENYTVQQEADVEFDVELPEFSLNQSLSSLKGQLTNFATGVLFAAVSSGTESSVKKLEYKCRNQELETAGGVVRGERGEVTAPPLLWVKALDMVMDKLIVAGVDFASVEALSGAAQQHGSVWWAKGAENRLASLSPEQFLHSQLAAAFVLDSPVWMDCSTSADCRALEEAVGGPEALARITGSRAYERFTGAQIRKIFRTRLRAYQATERISLVSSFACSLFVGKVTPIDLADGSGMNLLDIHKKTWCEQALMACGDETLAAKLGAPVPSASVVGAISDYYVQRYGFKPDCKVVAFTGDNCSALAGLRLRAGWVGLSLGTSDTLLLGLQSPKAPPAGHILIGPTSAPYMALLCFANGSLTRQAHRDRLVGPSWDAFTDLLRATVRGNMGYMGVYYDTAEIVPRAPPLRRLVDASGRAVDKLAPQFEARALLEGQALARRAHAEDMGLALERGSRVVATGGASVNTALLQIFADVFDAPVYVQDSHANAALLGAAIRAAEVWSEQTGISLNGSELTVSPVAKPYPDAERIYAPMLRRYREIIADIPALQ